MITHSLKIFVLFSVSCILLISCGGSPTGTSGDGKFEGVPSGDIVPVEMRDEVLTGIGSGGMNSKQVSTAASAQKWWLQVTSKINYTGCAGYEDQDITLEHTYFAFKPEGGLYVKQGEGGSEQYAGSWEWSDESKSAIVLADYPDVAFELTALNEDQLVYASLQEFEGGCQAVTWEQFSQSGIGENNNDDSDDYNDDDFSEVDITNYSNPDMNGNWRMSEEHEESLFYLSIDGNNVTLCRVNIYGSGRQINGHLGPENFIYPFSEDTVWVPYNFDETRLSTILGDPSSEWFNPDESNYTTYFRDSDYNPCTGNVSNNSFMFQFEEGYLAPEEYSVYINDEFLFDETSIVENDCRYSLTPSTDYTIDVAVRYKYCPGVGCAFEPERYRIATYRETIKLEHLRNYSCNTLVIKNGSSSSGPDLSIDQD